MIVNSIHNSIPFTRAIKISSNLKGNTDIQNRDLENILNRNYSKLYTRKEERKLRSFFREVLGDYNAENPVIIRQNMQGDTVILSGHEAKNIKALEDKKLNERHHIRKMQHTSHKQKSKMIKQTYKDVASAIDKELENGQRGKATSGIDITYQYNSKGSKIAHIFYESLGLEYSKFKDGHMLTRDERKSSDDEVFVSSVVYETNSLRLDA